MLAAVGYASVQARVRARRSRLLGTDVWRELIEAGTLARTLDVVRATPYGVPDANGHPDGELVPEAMAQLQRTLRSGVRRETIGLAASVPPAARELLEWWADSTLVGDLKLLVRALHHGYPLDAVWPATTLVDRDDPRLAGLAHVRSVGALVAALEGTAFGRPLADAWERARQERRPFYLEVALDLAYQRGLVARIEALSGADRSDAVELLGRALALENLIAAGRYRALSGVSPEEVVNFCLHRDFGGGLAMVQRVATGGSLRTEAAALGIALPAQEDDAATLLALERASDRRQREAARTRFGRQPFGLGLVLAYLIERRAEAADLVALVEAKAQGLDPDALRARIHREVA